MHKTRQSFLTQTNPTFRASITFLFRRVNLFLRPYRVFHHGTNMPLNIVFKRVFLRHNRFPRNSRRTHLSTIRRLRHPKTCPKVTRRTGRKVWFVRHSMDFGTQHYLKAPPTRRRIHFTTISAFNSCTRAVCPAVPTPSYARGEERVPRQRPTPSFPTYATLSVLLAYGGGRVEEVGGYFIFSPFSSLSSSTSSLERTLGERTPYYPRGWS